jgi:DNA polymerase V
MHSIQSFDAPILASTIPLTVSLVRGHVQAGFPSPAEDLGAQRIDLAQLLSLCGIKEPVIFGI